MNLIISSPTKNIEYHNIEKVTLPSLSGELQILPNYAETFLILKKGKIIFINNKNHRKEIEINLDTQCYIKNNIINVLF